MNYTVAAYCWYLPISAILTIWVASTLFKNGKVFLVEIFHGNNELANAVNKLLLVGFYLVNLGYIVFTMTIVKDIISNQEIFEVLSKKIGLIILVLGFWHFFNMYLLFRGKRKSKENQMRKVELEQSRTR
ncbi:MAG: hypothetical protein ACHQFW_01110 [Chitinophagales bacterium]